MARHFAPDFRFVWATLSRHRLEELHQAFDVSIREHGYQGGYRCVYPIKVNQQRQVVEAVFNFGRPYHFGLEAGSKPELLAVLAVADNETPIICNGFKDDEYIEMVMLAKKIGRQITPVVEKFTELELIVRHAEQVGVKPTIGLRVKLASRGSGRWKVVRGLSLEIRLDRKRSAEGRGIFERARHGGHSAASAFSPWAARLQTSGRSRPPSLRWRASMWT